MPTLTSGAALASAGAALVLAACLLSSTQRPWALAVVGATRGVTVLSRPRALSNPTSPAAPHRATPTELNNPSANARGSPVQQRTPYFSGANLSLWAAISAAAAVAAGLASRLLQAAPATLGHIGSNLSRRQVFASTLAAGAAASAVPSASANGIVQFPPEQLKNRYFLMRAGLSPTEERGILLTNPVLATQISTNGLSAEGRRQVIQAMEALRSFGLEEEVVWLWPSINARCYEAAEILAQGLGVSRNRLVPEYVFLNARAVGAYERQPLSVMDEIHAQDALDPNQRPPRFTDGTPNESVADVLVRMAQLISKTETQYSSINVVLISPDSDNLSVLQAALTGVDVRQHASLGFQPGEVRVVDLTIQ